MDGAGTREASGTGAVVEATEKLPPDDVEPERRLSRAYSESVRGPRAIGVGTGGTAGFAGAGTGVAPATCRRRMPRSIADVARVYPGTRALWYGAPGAMDAPLQLLLAGIAAVAAGAVNALAGGGTLITFPVLVALGVPAVGANVTNTVALCPGYLGGTLAQRGDLRGQGRRLRSVLPASVLGGILGGVLLLQTGEKLFRDLVPFLILLASGLLAVQDPVRAWLARRAGGEASPAGLERWTFLPVGLASVYGGYFGAGLSVIVLSALGLTAHDSLTRLNALKQAVAFAVNVAAAVFFLFSGQVVWPTAVVMAAGALVGGVLGGKLAGRVKPSTLRWVVVTIGVAVSAAYFVRG